MRTHDEATLAAISAFLSANTVTQCPAGKRTPRASIKRKPKPVAETYRAQALRLTGRGTSA